MTKSRVVALLLLLPAFALAAQAGTRKKKAAPKPTAAPAGGDVAKTANPELVGLLTSQLGITPKQAEGGSGAVFSYAREKMKPEDYAKVEKAVPGVDGLVKAAPKIDASAATESGGTVGALAGIASQAGGSVGGGVGAVAALTPAFQKLGLSGETVGTFLPIVVSYVTKKGGTGVGDLLGGVLK